MGRVTETGGWRPLSPPRRASVRPQDEFTVSPFARLARVHALSTAGDAMVATALAGSIFFVGATSQARGKVFLYLLLTMAPFALVSPLIGPALDRARSGRRWVIIATALLRSILALLMTQVVTSLWFYPEAFLVLVLQKGYAVARSAIVPSTVADDSELVEANSKLSLLSGLMGFVGAAPAALLFKLGGPEWALGLAAVVFFITAIVGLQLTHEPVATEAVGADEKAELRGVGLLLGASAIGLIRGIVGYLTLLLAFDFRKGGVPKWHFAVVGAVSLIGSLVGAVIAPRLRRHVTEERILTGVLVAIVIAGLFSVALGGVPGAALIGFTVGVGSVAGKLAFDSIVQRDAPDANRGRSFAKFETRFQLIWVIGALLGLIPRVTARWGFSIVTVVAAFAAGSYTLGSLAWKHRSGVNTPATERAVEIEAKINEGKAAARRGLARSIAEARVRLGVQKADRQARREESRPAPPFGPKEPAPPAEATTAEATTAEAPTAPPGWGRPDEMVTEDTPNWKR